MNENVENKMKGIIDGIEEMKNNDSKDDIDSNSSIDSNSNSKITIKKKENNSDKHIQRLFYITPELDKFLERTKSKTGRDKSEIVRLALSYLENNLKIQE